MTKPEVENIDVLKAVLNACRERHGWHEPNEQQLDDMRALCHELETIYQAAPTHLNRGSWTPGDRDSAPRDRSERIIKAAVEPPRSGCERE